MTLEVMHSSNEMEHIEMMNNPNELTTENSSLVLIDHQPGIALFRALH